jgi:hypothetical protein
VHITFFRALAQNSTVQLIEKQPSFNMTMSPVAGSYMLALSPRATPLTAAPPYVHTSQNEHRAMPDLVPLSHRIIAIASLVQRTCKPL